MTANAKSPGVRALGAWSRLSDLPFGKHLFSKLIGLYIPYSGSIKAVVEELRPGHSIVHLKERRRVRNHLNSVHAIALANLAELATGLAALSGMPDGNRGILTGLSLEYHKKARGHLKAICDCELPSAQQQEEFVITAKIYDEKEDCVATGQAHWLIGPIPAAVQQRADVAQ